MAAASPSTQRTHRLAIPLGPTLIIMAGFGWAQPKVGPLRKSAPGMSCFFLTLRKHWHCARQRPHDSYRGAGIAQAQERRLDVRRVSDVALPESRLILIHSNTSFPSVHGAGA